MTGPRTKTPAGDAGKQRWAPERPMGLSRALMKAGYGTRPWADEVVRAGRVRVGESVVTNPLHMIDVDAEVFLDDRPLLTVTRCYYAFHKPLRVVCREEDDPGRRLVSEYFPPDGVGLRTAGRLDARTSGLLLVSNDGDWITRVTGLVGCEHEFMVRVEGEVSDIQLTVIDAGIVLPGLGTFRPVNVRVISHESGRTLLSITLHGGQSRQMRRMLATLRHKVTMVRRVRLGGIGLGDLAAGGLRPLTAQEIASFDAPAGGGEGRATAAARRRSPHRS